MISGRHCDTELARRILILWQQILAPAQAVAHAACLGQYLACFRLLQLTLVRHMQ